MSHIIYEGPSAFDGQEDVCVIVTGITSRSVNAKTGNMAQAWILLQNIDPVEAVRTGADQAICNDCVHRRLKSCYVNVGRAPRQIWKKYRAEQYTRAGPGKVGKMVKKVRIGAYGDPAAVPVKVWRKLLQHAKGFTGYTHSWQRADPELRRYCMASVESAEERSTAKLAGWRTYRVRTEDEPLMLKEVDCPSSKGVQCAACLGCAGTAAPNSIDFTIPVHGLQWKINRFQTEKSLQQKDS